MVFASLRRHQRPILIAVTAFVLLTFSITGTMLLAFGKGDAPGNASFRLPSGEKVDVDREMIAEYATAYRFATEFLPFFDPRSSDNGVYSFLMLHKAALDLGLDVSDENINTAIRQRFRIRTDEQYQGFLKAMGLRARSFEEFVRRALVVDRYLAFVGGAYVVPSPAEVEAAWKKEHERITLAVASFPSSAEEAKLAAPSEDDVRSWFGALSSDRKNRYWSDERVAIDGLSFSLADAAKLDAEPLAPLLAGVTISDEDVSNFYEANKAARYRREAPATMPETAPASQPDPYLPLAEVRDRVVRELRVARMLSRVLEEARAPGAPPLEEIGKKYGLETFSHPLTTSTELRALPRFGDDALRGRVFFLAEGAFLDTPAFSPESAFLVRAAKRAGAGVPEFAEVRDRATADWKREKAAEAATKAATEFKEEVEKRTEPDAFELEAAARSLTVATIGPFAKEERLFPEFQSLPTGTDKFLRQNPYLYDVEVGKVSDPIEEPGAEEGTMTAHVVKVLARESGDPSNMRAWELRPSIGAAQMDRTRKFFEEVVSFEGLRKRFDFRFAGEDAKTGS